MCHLLEGGFVLSSRLKEQQAAIQLLGVLDAGTLSVFS
jgi:hypothetical protein